MGLKRVAALYDIHANLPALDAVIADLDAAGVDHIVVGGDVVPGPMPRETLARLLSLEHPVSFIQGNGEVAVFQERVGTCPERCPTEPARSFAGQPSRCPLPISRSWPAGRCS